MRAALRALVREPLVHFLILGAALFAIDGATSRGEEDDRGAPRPAFAVPTEPIVVDETVRATLSRQWEKTHPAPPTAEELDALVQRWIDEEVLYREGLSRGLAEGDAQVRERVAAQMAYVLQSRIAIPTPDEAELRAWFEAHADRWAEPDRVDFTQVFVEGRDDAAEAKARELLRLLVDGADPAGLGDTFPGGRRFRGRRIAELSERFGDAFTTGMATQAEGSWALRRSAAGVHLVRIDRRTPARAPDFDAMTEAVRHDWEAEQRASALAEAEAELRSRWEIVVSP